MQLHLLVAAWIILLSGVTPYMTSAMPGEPGVIPDRVGHYDLKKYPCEQGSLLTAMVIGTGSGALAGSIGGPLGVVVGAGGGIIGSFVGYYINSKCSQSEAETLDSLRVAYRNAYKRAEVGHASPGWPANDVHPWARIQIQDFQRGRDSNNNLRGDGWGAIIWGGLGSPYPPEYVGGGFWVAYKDAVNGSNAVGSSLYPGYPSGPEHVWNNVTLQEFVGGSWGGSAIIGNDDAAYIVAGGHWSAYKKADGSRKLGNPLGKLYRANDGWYTQDFEGGKIRELGGEFKIEFDNTYGTSGEVPKELPAVGRQEPKPTPKPAATCNDAGKPILTSNLSALPSNPDTKTPVKFSFTIRNDGCGTFAPQKMIIAGRDPFNNVSDPTQRDGFRLAPGESYTFEHTATLKQPGTHKFWVAYMDWTNNWPKVPNTSGQVLEVHITVTEARPDPTPVPTAAPPVETEAPTEPPAETPEASEPEPTEPSEIESSDSDSESVPQESEPIAVPDVESDSPESPDSADDAAVCTEGALPTFRDASDGLDGVGRTPGAVPVKIDILNPGCSLFESDSVEIYSDSPNGTSSILMSIGSFALEPGGEWVIHQEFILTDPGEYRIRVVTVRDGVTSHLLLENDGSDGAVQPETRDYFSIHVSGSNTGSAQPSQIQPVDIEPDGSGPVTTNTTNPVPSAPSPTEVVGCDMVWDGQKWVVESC